MDEYPCVSNLPRQLTILYLAFCYDNFRHESGTAKLERFVG